MAGYTGVLVIFFCVIFAAVVVLVPVLYEPGDIPEAPSGMSFVGGINKTFVRHCPCAPPPYGTPYMGDSDPNSLENPRKVSNAIFNQEQRTTSPLSAMAWLMGQFFDHETTETRSTNELVSINITGDLVFVGINELTIYRLQARIDEEGCRLPMNFQSPLVDASNVYGYNATLFNLLRSNTGGRLRTSAGDMLPFKDPSNPTEFLCGDHRCMEHAGLTSMHTIWLREHNYWAGVIAGVRGDWSSDQVFWKARQLVIAEMQKIIYEDWLPALLGSQASLLGTPNYDPALKPDVHIEFGAVAFRMGHSLVNDQIDTDSGPVTLIQLFTQSLRRHSPTSNLGELMKGFTKTPAEKMDAKVVSSLRNFLFGPMGLDLVTMNIARGNEIGLPRYGEILRCIMGRTGPETSSTISAMQGLFQEELVQGSNVGPTIGTILAEHFKRFRDADPNFYTRDEQKRALGSILYKQVRRVTMKEVLVRNTGIKAEDLKDNVFLV